MEELKEAGYWLVGLDETAEKKTTPEVDYTTPTGVVMGGEGNGLHELTASAVISWCRCPPPAP